MTNLQPAGGDTVYIRPFVPLLIVLSGPSGVGKDTVMTELKRRRDWPFHFVVTATTRPARAGEVDGVDYHFVSLGSFAELIDRGELLEHAVVYGDHKGIPKQQVRDALAGGRDVVLRIDVQGAATIRRLAPEAVSIYLSASSEEELIARLIARKSDPPEAIKMRIATAREEMKRVNEFDYCVVNPDGGVPKAVDEIMAIVRAEHLRTRPRRVSL
jgi:guanylate kinase